jgi:hypothetical protein
MVVVVLVLLPVAFLAAAAVAALVSVRRSSVRMTAAGVEIRNYPQPAKLIPLAQIARFEMPVPSGNFASARPRTGVLVLTDGSRLAVRSLSEPEAGYGIDALNARLESLRRNP